MSVILREGGGQDPCGSLPRGTYKCGTCTFFQFVKQGRSAVLFNHLPTGSHTYSAAGWLSCTNLRICTIAPLRAIAGTRAPAACSLKAIGFRKQRKGGVYPIMYLYVILFKWSYQGDACSYRHHPCTFFFLDPTLARNRCVWFVFPGVRTVYPLYWYLYLPMRAYCLPIQTSPSGMVSV